MNFEKMKTKLLGQEDERNQDAVKWISLWSDNLKQLKEIKDFIMQSKTLGR